MVKFKCFLYIITLFSIFLATNPPDSSAALISTDENRTLGTISYESINKPLVDFCNAIKKQTKYDVIIDDEWLVTPVTLLLKGVSVEDGIGIALKQLNLSHSLIISPNENRIQIYIANNSLTNVASNDPESHSNITKPNNSVSSGNNQFPDQMNTPNETNDTLDIFVVPPEEGVENTTEGELAIKNGISSSNNIDIPAVPPEEGVETITERELSIKNETSTSADIDTSAVPPEDGVETITERELSLRNEITNSNNPDISIVPPEEGVKSITEGELSIRNREMNTGSSE